MEFTILLISIIIILVVGMLVIAIIIFKGANNKASSQESKFIQNDLANLREEVSKLSQSLIKNMYDNSENLRENVDRKLEQTQKGMSAQMENSRKIVEEITKSLVKLEDTNKHVIDTQSELKTLQNVLMNNKTRGNLGEYYLEDILGNVLPPTIWQKQYKFKNNEVVDAIVKLKDGKILPIDSKFPMQNFERVQNAETKEIREKFQNELKKDIKNRIDETSKYVRPAENTMDFAFMFIPSEALYYDAIINDVGNGGSSRNLIEYAFREKNVIIVSPTTLLAYLQTVMQGLQALEIEQKAKDISRNVEKLGMHIKKYDEYMHKIGGSLSTTVNHYNNAGKEFAKIDKDVVRVVGGELRESVPAIDKPYGWNE